MTLILTRASINYVLQVTDRLVTLNRVPFDELANKNILYCARNAVVTIGYTGFSYLNGKPTDQWIVENLTGLTFDRDRKPPAFGPGVPNPKLDIGFSLLRLKTALNEVTSDMRSEWRRGWKARSFDISIAGWQWNEKERSRPLIAWLSKPRDSITFELGYTSRQWYLGGRLKVTAAPSENITRSQFGLLGSRLSFASPDETEAILIGTVRDVSTRVPEVGPHCMSILISPPSVGQIRVRYVPVSTAAAVVSATSANYRLAVAFSPWFVGPNVTVAPAVMSGSGWQIPMGPYIVVPEAPNNPELFEIYSSQQRPYFS